MIPILQPENFSQYELIDAGNFEKLERFGQYIVARPEPQALWDKSLTSGEWERMAHAYFKLAKTSKSEAQINAERGEWQLKKGMPGRWPINYNSGGLNISMRLALTSFKHVGIFPEQAANWQYIYQKLIEMGEKEKPVLNLFAYTGGASLAACAGGATVSHVDSVKQVVSWARENMEASKQNGIRWVVEDALKFVQREARRGNKYSAIILDPPAYGRGPDGEKWVLEQSINELLKLCNQLLAPQNAFMVLNLYSMGFSPLVAESLAQSTFSNIKSISSGELYVADKAKRKLPLGIFCRMER